MQASYAPHQGEGPSLGRRAGQGEGLWAVCRLATPPTRVGGSLLKGRTGSGEGPWSFLSLVVLGVWGFYYIGCLYTSVLSVRINVVVPFDLLYLPLLVIMIILADI